MSSIGSRIVVLSVHDYTLSEASSQAPVMSATPAEVHAAHRVRMSTESTWL